MNKSNRSLTPSSLDPMFTPRAIALIGASESQSSVGHALMTNLMRSTLLLFPVNPKRQRILGVTAFPSITAVSEDIDLAVIATPAATVPGILRDCAHRGVRAAIIISAGFRESGAE